jgi:hypothetical protein
VTERMIEADGAELCTEAFGDPADPPILLVMGIGASMLWWEDGFCALLAGGWRFVIRYVSVIEYLVAYARVLAGGERTFDEAAVRELVSRDVARARDFSASATTTTSPTTGARAELQPTALSTPPGALARLRCTEERHSAKTASVVRAGASRAARGGRGDNVLGRSYSDRLAMACSR